MLAINSNLNDCGHKWLIFSSSGKGERGKNNFSYSKPFFSTNECFQPSMPGREGKQVLLLFSISQPKSLRHQRVKGSSTSPVLLTVQEGLIRLHSVLREFSHQFWWEPAQAHNKRAPQYFGAPKTVPGWGLGSSSPLKVLPGWRWCHDGQVSARCHQQQVLLWVQHNSFTVAQI